MLPCFHSNAEVISIKIKLFSSMVFDAICACSLIEDNGQYHKTAQNEILNILKSRTGDTFKEGSAQLFHHVRDRRVLSSGSLYRYIK